MIYVMPIFDLKVFVDVSYCLLLIFRWRNLHLWNAFWRRDTKSSSSWSLLMNTASNLSPSLKARNSKMLPKKDWQLMTLRRPKSVRRPWRKNTNHWQNGCRSLTLWRRRSARLQCLTDWQNLPVPWWLAPMAGQETWRGSWDPKLMPNSRILLNSKCVTHWTFLCTKCNSHFEKHQYWFWR